MWRELCILPRVVGPCRASFPRWYYNQAVKKCLKFIYGGCEGNMNNFRTKAECKKRCIRRRIKARARSGSVWSHYSLRRRNANRRRYRHGWGNSKRTTLLWSCSDKCKCDATTTSWSWCLRGLCICTLNVEIVLHVAYLLFSKRYLYTIAEAYTSDPMRSMCSLIYLHCINVTLLL